MFRDINYMKESEQSIVINNEEDRSDSHFCIYVAPTKHALVTMTAKQVYAFTIIVIRCICY